ncbi:hypothetical protein QJS04_geneDACA018811 [Acorus gramineus]|uniref:RanBP2-type domain-containing protein n=1 Tax=Acorus gramineus TaxID=55184 RepID=A0AAV9BMV0_ACOGR|nr:hypothetical protein QJS04_geneDACA018811 [Acorus gramineus]
MYRRLSSLHVRGGGFFLHTLKNQSIFPIHSSSQNSNSRHGLMLRGVEELHQSMRPIQEVQGVEEKDGFWRKRGVAAPKGVEASHTWPEWVKLMELLKRRGYLDHSAIGGKESNRIRFACLSFGRDRFDLIRCLSRKDIQVVVECGCPSIDRKVVNSGKRLRAYLGIEEETVCSSCDLRGSCERAYVKAYEEKDGQTIDVMRILLTYGLDCITSVVENKGCLNDMVKESVKRLLKQIVEFGTKELKSDSPESSSEKFSCSSNQSFWKKSTARTNTSMLQGNWICPKCSFLNFEKNIKCLRCKCFNEDKLEQLKEENRDQLPPKKGDWICEKCNSLNFAKNTKCFQCSEKPSKRRLNPGEWECVSCNYLNFKRNVSCLKCDWRRPKSNNSGDTRQYSHPDGHNFVRSHTEINRRHSISSGSPNREEEKDFWSDKEDPSDNDESGSWTKFLELEDFPIVGGKSALSKDPDERERWKGEMLKKR